MEDCLEPCHRPCVPIPVGSIYFSVYWKIVIAQCVNSETKSLNPVLHKNVLLPIISIGQDPGWLYRIRPARAPLEVLQLAKLVPEAGVHRGQGLGDGGVVVGHTGLGGCAQVSIPWDR